MTVRIAVLTVSDRASRGEYEDLGGPAVKAWLERVMSSPAEIVVHVIPDGLESVRDTLIRLCDEDRVDMVLTTGGTGPSPRDLTPEP
jgi:molybdopterin adenylyltransferase